MNSLLNNFSDMQFPPQRQASQPNQQEYVSGTGEGSGSTESPDRSASSQMSEADKWGLEGFLATVRSPDPNVSGLARGQELNSLGLNLNSAEFVNSLPSMRSLKADRPIQAVVSDFCGTIRRST